MDTPFLIAYSPKFMTAVFAAVIDYFIVLCASLYIKPKNIWVVMLVNYLSVSIYYNSRMVVNVLESLFFLAGFYFWV